MHIMLLLKDERSAKAWVTLGNPDLLANAFSTARTCCRKALAIDPQRAEVLGAMALLAPGESAQAAPR